MIYPQPPKDVSISDSRANVERTWEYLVPGHGITAKVSGDDWGTTITMEAPKTTSQVMSFTVQDVIRGEAFLENYPAAFQPAAQRYAQQKMMELLTSSQVGSFVLDQTKHDKLPYKESKAKELGIFWNSAELDSMIRLEAAKFLLSYNGFVFPTWPSDGEVNALKLALRKHNASYLRARIDKHVEETLMSEDDLKAKRLSICNDIWRLITIEGHTPDGAVTGWTDVMKYDDRFDIELRTYKTDGDKYDTVISKFSILFHEKTTLITTIMFTPGTDESIFSPGDEDSQMWSPELVELMRSFKTGADKAVYRDMTAHQDSFLSEHHCHCQAADDVLIFEEDRTNIWVKASSLDILCLDPAAAYKLANWLIASASRIEQDNAELHEKIERNKRR